MRSSRCKQFSYTARTHRLRMGMDLGSMALTHCPRPLPCKAVRWRARGWARIAGLATGLFMQLRTHVILSMSFEYMLPRAFVPTILIN